MQSSGDTFAPAAATDRGGSSWTTYVPWALTAVGAASVLAWQQAPAWGYGLAGVVWCAGAAYAWSKGRSQRCAADSMPLAASDVLTTKAPAPSPDVAVMLNASLSVEEQESLRYAISHDLRAPLRVVEGFTRIVKEDHGDALDPVAHAHLDRVMAAADRMGCMIDALLAQVQMASMPLERQAVDITVLVQEVAREQCGALPAQPHPVVHVDDRMVALADATLLRRLFENLLGNALKYTSKVHQPVVSIGIMPETSPQVFYVRDNGAGFDMKNADRLFDMFQRLHSAKDFPGTGVGLAAVRQIVQRHGGRIWAEAEVGNGACFYFTLDASQFQQRRAER